MNRLGIFIFALGIFYLIYSIMFRNKPTIYFGNIKIIKGKEEEYLKFQLYTSILNSFILIIIGGITAIYNLTSPFIILTPVLFHLINYIVKIISKRKEYVES